MKRFLDRGGEIGDVLDEKIVLDAGTRDTHGVNLLKGVETDRVRGDLARDDHHRDRVHVGGGDARDCVRHAGAGSDEANPDLVGSARVAVGGVRGALLVAHEHVLDLVLLEELVVDEKHRAAGVTEDVLDAFFLQAAHDDFRAGQRCGFDSVHHFISRKRRKSFAE
jgi:hypothetical protein